MTEPSTTNKDGFSLPAFIPQLDGLRGIAILAVFAYHDGFRMQVFHFDTLTKYGWAGVDLFFVLSGFLITGILLDSRGGQSKTPKSYFLNFYARRALRIWPLYYAFLIVITVAGPWFRHDLAALHTTYPWWLYALYLQNLVFAGSFPMVYTWSLAVEEQFYFLWPLVVSLFKRETVLRISLAAIMLSPVLRAVCLHNQVSWEAVSIFPFTRLDGLAWGACIACFVRDARCTKERLAAISRTLLIVGAASVAVVIALNPFEPRDSYPVYSALGVFFAGVVGAAIGASDQSLLMRALNVGWLRFIGKVSYCIYIIHLPVLQLIETKLQAPLLQPWHNGVAANLITLALQLTATLCIAALSWKLFESPILKLKRYFPYQTNQS